MLRLIREQEPEKTRQAIPGDHPTVEQLERFMHGELPSAEAAHVVRHLLKRCGDCLKVTSGLWAARGDRLAKAQGGLRMAGSNVALRRARQQVSRVIGQMETVHWQLAGVAQSLPESAEESADTREAAELRRVIECVLEDRIRFALGDLRSVLPSEGEDEDP